MDNKTSPKPVKLAEDTITQGELVALSDWMLSGKKLTKAEETLAFELEFSSWVGSQYAIFTNSGSSSNLLMIFALKELGLLRNNKAIAASVSWVTTVSPLLQFGFETVLCDCDPKNLGLDLNHLEHLCKTERPSVLILVHVLGHANKMKEILEICERYGVHVLEDACEALGSSYSGKKLSTHGLAGSFSFYYGHHISTIEGGMVVTDNFDLYQVMLSLRSHGWSRDLASEVQQKLTKQNNIDEFSNLYTFYYPGFNLRATDLQAFIGRSQLKKIDAIADKREDNFYLYKDYLSDFFIQESSTEKLSSFAYGTLVKNRSEVAEYLSEQKIECRPLICGNIGRHPFWLKKNEPCDLPNADKIHDFGIYLPNHANLTNETITTVCEAFCDVAIPV